MNSWKFERSSGFAGYRNNKTGEWLSVEEFDRKMNQKSEIQRINIESKPASFLHAISNHLKQIGDNSLNLNSVVITDGTISFEVTDANRSCLDFINAVALGWNLRSKV